MTTLETELRGRVTWHDVVLSANIDLYIPNHLWRSNHSLQRNAAALQPGDLDVGVTTIGGHLSGEKIRIWYCQYRGTYMSAIVAIEGRSVSRWLSVLNVVLPPPINS